MRRDPVLGAAIKRIGPCGMADAAAQGSSDRARRRDRQPAAVDEGGGDDLRPLRRALSRRRDPGRRGDRRARRRALRGVGLSGQKVGYLRDLCARIGDGRLGLDELDALDDEEVIERLTAVKGFGRWTAEMFLMFRLHRPDVLPVGDLGIVNAVQRLYRLRKRPTRSGPETRRSVAAVPIGRVLVSLADAARIAELSSSRQKHDESLKPSHDASESPPLQQQQHVADGDRDERARAR